LIAKNISPAGFLNCWHFRNRQTSLNSGSSVFFLTVVLKRLFFNSFAEEGGKMQLFNKKKGVLLL